MGKAFRSTEPFPIVAEPQESRPVIDLIDLTRGQIVANFPHLQVAIGNVEKEKTSKAGTRADKASGKASKVGTGKADKASGNNAASKAVAGRADKADGKNASKPAKMRHQRRDRVMRRPRHLSMRFFRTRGNAKVHMINRAVRTKI